MDEATLRNPNNLVVTAALHAFRANYPTACASFICIPNANASFTGHYFSGSQDSALLQYLKYGVRLSMHSLKQPASDSEQAVILNYSVVEKHELQDRNIIFYEAPSKKFKQFSFKTPEIVVNNDNPVLAAQYGDKESLMIMVETLEHYSSNARLDNNK
jgi:hypothetical protein